MKRNALVKPQRRYGCFLKREVWSHSLWTNPATGEADAVPRHTEVPDVLARKICRGLLGAGDRAVALGLLTGEPHIP